LGIQEAVAMKRYLPVCLLLCSAANLRGGVITAIIDAPPANGSWVNIKETGPFSDRLNTTVWVTNKGDRIKNNLGADIVQQGMLDDFVDFGPGIAIGSRTFKFAYQYNGKKVTDYQQRTGDPGWLFASAFDAGVMVDDLPAWLAENGYIGDNNTIVQPDFLPIPNTSDIYYGVDLAQLGNAGAAFILAHVLGDTFTISGDQIAGLPGYLFSSTPPTYVEGSGWTVTPLPDGTQVTYGAFHNTSVNNPEPGSLLLLSGGLVLIRRIRNR
jgi:hypothetical protein